MKLTILGNNGPFPAEGGACSSYLIEHGGKHIILDMGPGSLANLQKYIDIRQIDAIVISHLHYDHISDIFSLKYALGLLRDRENFIKKIKLFIPASPKDISNEISEDPSFHTIVLSNGLICDLFDMEIEACRMTHPVETYAICLTSGEKKFVYSGDTTLNDAIGPFSNGADVYLCDAGLLEEHYPGPHMTVAQACQSAKNCKKTLLTHISPLYDMKRLQHEVKGDAVFAQIGEQYDI